MSDWPIPAAAASLEMELIQTVTLAAPAASFSISGISTSYRTFEAIAYIIADANPEGITCTFNNDTTAGHYAYQYTNASGATLTVNRITSSTTWAITASVIAASMAGLFYWAFSKPSAAQHAAGVAQCANLNFGSNAEEMWTTSAEWINAADLITRMDVVSNTAYATGSKLSLGGARAA